MREKKRESVVTENPKRGIAKNFGRIQREDQSNVLGKLRHGRGDRKLKSSKVIRGDYFSEVTFKGAIG